MIAHALCFLVALTVFAAGCTPPTQGPQTAAASATRSADPELVIQLGHWGSVVSMAISSDGNLLATIGVDRSLRIWDLRDGRMLRAYNGGYESIPANPLSLQFSQDGKWLLTGEPRLISIETGETRRLVNPDSPDRSGLFAAFIVGDTQVIGPGTIRWDTRTLQPLPRSSTDDCDGEIAVSPDGKQLLFRPGNSNSNDVIVIETATGNVIANTRGLPGNHAVLPVSGFLVASRIDQKRVSVRDAIPGKVFREIDCSAETKNAEGVAISPDSTKLVIGGHGLAWIVDIATGDVLQRFPIEGDSPFVFCFTPDGQQLIAAGYAAGDIRVWDIKTGKTVRLFNASLLPIRAAAISRDSRELATDAWGRVNLWDLKTITPKREIYKVYLPEQNLSCLAFSPDGKILARGGADTNAGALGEIQLFDLQHSGIDPTRLLDFGSEPQPGPVWDIQYSADGNSLRTTHRNLLDNDNLNHHFWNVANGRESNQSPLKTRWLDPASSDGLWIIPLDGALLVTDPDGRVRATLRWLCARNWNPDKHEIDEGTPDWLWTTPDGRWTGSPGAERYVSYRINGEIKPASALPRLHDAAAVRRAIRGQ